MTESRWLLGDGRSGRKGLEQEEFFGGDGCVYYLNMAMVSGVYTYVRTYHVEHCAVHCMSAILQ